MPLELLVEEAKGMSDEKIMEVVRFIKFIKLEEYSYHTEEAAPSSHLREAGYFKSAGKGWMADDFNDPLADFKEYM